jgi:hypothetical protein
MLDYRDGGPDDAALMARLGAETFTETFGHLYSPENLAAFLAGLEGVPEVGFTLAGSTFLAIAHIRNWQLRSRPPRQNAGRCDRASGA